MVLKLCTSFQCDKKLAVALQLLHELFVLEEESDALIFQILFELAFLFRCSSNTGSRLREWRQGGRWLMDTALRALNNKCNRKTIHNRRKSKDVCCSYRSKCKIKRFFLQQKKNKTHLHHLWGKCAILHLYTVWLLGQDSKEVIRQVAE